MNTILSIPSPAALPLPRETTIAKAEPKAPRVKAKCDPRLVAAARALRDRWLEQVNATPLVDVCKYGVARQIVSDVVNGEVVSTQLLAA